MSLESPEPKPPLSEIFLKAIEMPSAAQRDAYLQEICGNDEELRARVDALLQNQQDDGFLERPAVECSATMVVSAAPLEGPGTVIGKYKLLEKLGEGGFGVVYMAEQKHPVRRRVALKIIKVGMDTREVVARFEAERQALAIMDHPSIAKVFDAGATETALTPALSHPTGEGAPRADAVASGSPLPSDGRGIKGEGHSPLCTPHSALPSGRPYFVMELVRGIRITDYCDQKNLSTRERLDLFMLVCQAVQHAHQKGIIHRDLKPSNILVTVNDGVAVPKIIDFGIAKATQMELTEKTVFTRFHQFIGTPAYISPEQAEITSVDVDTRSDIYSLGVLLYELLTGKTPFDAKELLQAGLDEMRRTLREKEPERPSTRVSTLDGEELTTTAKRRGLEAPKLVNLLRGDLDWIVMKCLEKDRARRYETANGLAMDIQRHLSNEPVVACPPSNLYRLHKLIRRNKGAFVAASAITFALVIGLGMAMWGLLRERAARERAVEGEKREVRLREQAQANEEKAKTEAEEKDQIAQFFEAMVRGVGPSVAMGRDTTILREILDAASARINAELTNQPAIEQYLRYTIGNVYNSIGQFEKAEASLRRAVIAGNKVTQVDYSENVFALWSLGRTLVDLEKREEAEATFREVLGTLEKLPTNDKSRDLMMANTLDQLGMCLRAQGRVSAGEPFALQALEMRPKFEGSAPRLVATMLNNTALFFREKGQYSEAEGLLRESLEIDHRLNLNEADKLYTHYNLAVSLEHGGKLPEAENAYRHCLEVAKKSVGDHPEAGLGYARNLSVYFYGLRAVLIKQGRLEEAEGCRREALASARSLADSLAPRTEDENPDIVVYRAEFLARLGRWADAARDLTRARELLGDDRILLWRTLARILFQAGELDAYRHYSKISLERFGGTKDLNLAQDIAMNCLILPSSGADLTTVSKMAETACALGSGSGRYVWYELCQGLAEYRQGHFAEAIECLQKVLADAIGGSRAPAYRALPGDPAESEVGAYAVLAMAYKQLKRVAEAHAALAKAVEIANAKLAKPGEEDLSYTWSDWIMAYALIGEAKELIETATGPGAVQSRAGLADGPQPPANKTRSKSE